MNSTSFNSTAKFRIQNNGSNTTDNIYFDAVTIKGRKNTTGSGTTVTLSAVTKGVSSAKGLVGALDNNIQDILSEDNEIVLYPNPVVNTLNIKAQGMLKAVRIYSSNGSLIRTIENVSVYNSFDLSDLNQGIYFVEISTNKGSLLRK